jgi:hypothetical protein
MRRTLVLITTALALLAATASAAMASPERIWEDCQDGKLDHKYSAKDYRKALSGLPTDIDEYTNCRDVIRRAQLGFDGGGSGGTGGGGGFTPSVQVGDNGRLVDPLGAASPTERKAIQDARAVVVPEISSMGVRPGDPGAAVPVPLIIVLVLTGAAAVALAAPRLRGLVPGRRSS